jgi:hypothetical protein
VTTINDSQSDRRISCLMLNEPGQIKVKELYPDLKSKGTSQEKTCASNWLQSARDRSGPLHRKALYE